MKQEIHTKEDLFAYINDALLPTRQPSPEKRWIGERFDAFMAREGIRKKGEADRILFEKIYNRPPASPSDLLKIRYWRTGRHVPGCRSDLLKLGKALGVSEPDPLRYLVRAYWDRSDIVFEKPAPDDPVYEARTALLRELSEDFLAALPAEFTQELGIRRDQAGKYFRHLYFCRSLRFVDAPDIRPSALLHLDSASYGKNLNRIMRLLGEIPRSAMLRTLIILGAPYLTEELLSDRLEALGFLPLTPGHGLPTGERLDDILIAILRHYERSCDGTAPAECFDYFTDLMRTADRLFSVRGVPALQIMRYRTLYKDMITTMESDPS